MTISKGCTVEIKWLVLALGSSMFTFSIHEHKYHPLFYLIQTLLLHTVLLNSEQEFRSHHTCLAWIQLIIFLLNHSVALYCIYFGNIWFSYEIMV